jgi:hypothetical protein
VQPAQHSRAVIDQAKQTLMNRHGCSSDVALQMPAAVAETGERKFRDVAAGW